MFVVTTEDTAGTRHVQEYKTEGRAINGAKRKAKDGAYETVTLRNGAEVTIYKENGRIPKGGSRKLVETVTMDKKPKNGGRPTRKPKAEATNKCQCGALVVTVPRQVKLSPSQRSIATDGPDDTTVLESQCQEVTRRNFAPGHDARFKGLVRLANANGGEIVLDGEKVTAAAVIGQFPTLFGQAAA